MRNVEANLIYDTGSDWVVVSSAQCSSCKGSEEKYDPEASNNYLEVGRTEDKTYGYSMSLKGRTVMDQVCLTKKDVCIDPLYFFLVSK